MEDFDIVKENENYRVRLELDEYPEKPYDDGATPILYREFKYYGARWEAFNKQGEDLVDELNALCGRVRREDEEEVIERYLRIFHGAYSVVFDSSEENRYISFDTAAWREEMGLTDEHLDRNPDIKRDELAEGSLKEVMAWAEGDVYGVIEERRLNRHTVTVYTDPVSGDEVRKSDTEGEYWETVESVWGYYGRKWAEQAAEEAFKNAVES